jgi:hypothetical protein
MMISIGMTPDFSDSQGYDNRDWVKETRLSFDVHIQEP